MCTGKSCTAKVSIKNFLKVPLSRNSLNMKGVVSFLFTVYPTIEANNKMARKFLKTNYSSDFDYGKMNEVFCSMRQLVAKEMLKRNSSRLMEETCHLSVTTWSNQPPSWQPVIALSG